MRLAVIDIGKPGKNLGWAIDEPDEQGTDLDACIETLIVSLDKGPVALGFEAPQFVPIRHDPLALLAGRKGDFGRPFSAAAGATVLVTSLPKPGELLLFEAFVTDQRKDTPTRHIEDAHLAVGDFRRGMVSPETFESSVTSDECMNLLGAAVLRTGWSSDVALLSSPCLVIRSGNIHTASATTIVESA